ncbi:hypothetical protein ACFBZI_05485 [Moraxella sp. ZJ142]|uniref:hypothetical protein n=1 Tax=Moraxella marmotae TaxID=3344520 RepID=UPI0035D412B3
MSQTTAIGEKYFRRQAFYWLVAAAVAAVLWLLIWLTSAAPAIIHKNHDDEIKSSDLALPATITELHELKKEVQLLDNSVLVRDFRSYPAEFKDKTYFNGLGGRYVLQLMDVAENEVIVDYLNGRSDRDQFAYFRYTDANDRQRYVLTYGKFATAAEADAGLKTVDFALPSTIKPKTTKASNLVATIDSYELNQDVVDLASTQPRRVRLQATRTEIPVKAATAKDEELARLSRERAEQAQRQANPSNADIQNDIKHLSERPTPSPIPQNDLPMAPTARPEPAPEPEAPKAEKAAPKAEAKPAAPTPPTIAPTARPTTHAADAPTIAPTARPTAHTGDAASDGQ